MSLDETVKEKDLVDLLWVFGCESSTVSSMIACLNSNSLLGYHCTVVAAVY